MGISDLSAYNAHIQVISDLFPHIMRPKTDQRISESRLAGLLVISDLSHVGGKNLSH